MTQRNFVIVNGDTDSIMFCKPDQSTFSKEEQLTLLQEINNLLPDAIKFENDGVFSKVVCLKAKNYIMVDQKGKRKVKGSSLKSSTLEPALKQLLADLVECVMQDNHQDMVNVYHSTIRTIRDGIPDIKPWSKKMQLSPTTYNSTRANETKVIDAIQGTEYKSGDRIYVFITPEEKLCLTERYEGRYNIDAYLEKAFKTTKRFETILPVKEMFLNYSLKRNKKVLEKL